MVANECESESENLISGGESTGANFSAVGPSSGCRGMYFSSVCEFTLSIKSKF